MHDAEVLYRRIVDTPDDDTVRLIYADVIEEAGERDRAEFIRLQIQWSQTRLGAISRRRRDKMYRRMLGLLKFWAVHWLPELPDLSIWRDDDAGGIPVYGWVDKAREGTYQKHPDEFIHTYFSRGFPCSMSTSLPQFLRYAGSLFLAAPITRVTLRKQQARIEQGSTVAYWFREGLRSFGERAVRATEALPSCLFDRLPLDGMLSPNVWYGSSYVAASLALSEACVGHGRELRAERIAKEESAI